MAEIAGMLAAGVLKVAAGKLTDAARDRLMLQWRFSEDLEDMQDTVESIQAVLEDAEGQSILNASVRLWLKRLGRASNDIADIFDEFEVKKTRKSRLRKLKVLNPCLKHVPEFGMASKMKIIRDKLEKITNHHHKFTFIAGSSSYEQKVIDERATYSEVIEANIVGRNEEKHKLISKLLTRSSTSPEVIILPIYGIGGMGKTTLAQLVFNDWYFKDYGRAWVYIGQTFDFQKIKDDVGSELQMEQSKLSNTQEPGCDLTGSKKKFLIVLDDLWETNVINLKILKNYLKSLANEYELHVIVTTRDESIAKEIQTTEAHNIEPLSSEMCWNIIKQIISKDKTEAEIKELEDMGKEIAQKCGGVALAARALGYMLKFRNHDGWDSVKKSGMWNVISSGYTFSSYDNVLASLKLTYSSMPPYLRLCFAYCAIFPKGQKMAKDDLIYQWAALGFIKQSEEVSVWQHGEICIKKLLEMSFFQHFKSSSSHRGYVKSFTMHDLVHDLASDVMGDELFDASRVVKSGGTRNCRYALLKDCSTPLSSFVTYSDKIRAVRCLGSGETGQCSIGFSTASYLKVLDLGESSLDNLPSSVVKLKMLRYLNAPGIKDQEIPSCITKLSELIYLNLRGSSQISALPESIGEMESLMYLDLSGCCGIKKLPKSFVKLKSLVHLDLSHCTGIVVIPRELNRLTNLQRLNLSCSSSQLKQGLLEVIHELTGLLYLCLSSCLEGLTGETLIGILDRINTLPNLEHLDLSGNGSIKYIPDSISSLTKLQTLDLSRCSNLTKLPKEKMESMESLRLLLVDGCDSLDISTLPINKNLIPLPHFVVPPAKEGEESKLVLLKDVSPDVLRISRLENVKSAAEAEKIKIWEKESLVELTLDWTRGNQEVAGDMELLKALAPPSSLRSFQLQGYNSVSFPAARAWLTGDGARPYPNIVRVELKNLSSRCASLPALGHLPKLEELHLEAMPGVTKTGRALCGDHTYRELRRLTISDMENLEEWNTACCDGGEEGGIAADEVLFPNLEELTIRRCPKLRLHPRPARVKGTFRISNSDSVLSQWEEESIACSAVSSSVPAVAHTLEIESCMVPMHQWKLLHHLPGLHSLVIKKCADLSGSAEIARALGPLHSLTFADMDIQEPPQWLGHLVSLKELTVQDCSITYIPDSILDGGTNVITLGKCPGLVKTSGDKDMEVVSTHQVREDGGVHFSLSVTAHNNNHSTTGVSRGGCQIQLRRREEK